MNTNFINKKMYIFLLSIFVLYLFNADFIALKIANISYPKVADKSLENIENSNAYSEIERITQIGDEFESLELYGWAFCESDKSISEKKVNLLFKSKNDSYYIDATIAIRPDIYYRFKDNLDLYNANVGFQARFSTINMKNGRYEMYINVIENSDYYGCVKTNYFFEKDNRGLHKVDNVEFDIENLEKTNKIKFALDKLNISDGKIFYSGWAIMDGVDSLNSTTYLSIKDSKDNINLFPVKSISREDIVTAFKDNAYIKSGMYNEIIPYSISPGEIEVNVIIDNGRKYTSEKIIRYFYDGDLISEIKE